MNFNLFKDVAEIKNNIFSESPLGKEAKDYPLDKPINMYDELPNFVAEGSHCPINNGDWKDERGNEGERGNSVWCPDPDYVPQKGNPEGKTWREILDKYDIEGIEYKEGEPDFSEISKGDVEIEPYSQKRDDNFDKADTELAKEKDCTPEEVAKWRKENGYTWHECKDMKTMQKVPSEVHNNVTHSGGIAESKKDVNNNE